MQAKVLLVDDDRAICESLGRALRTEGYDVTTAPGGFEALDLFRQAPFDLVLLDINMPVLNGWATLREMKEINPFVRVIVITARPNQQELAAQAGVEILEKPLVLPSLVDLMRKLLTEAVGSRRV
jgi:DNA-binding response OmpR family regulator